MDPQAVNQAFATFLDRSSFSATQIDCIEIIMRHYIDNGFMELKQLREQPFKNFHSEGVIGLFGRDRATQLVKLIESMNTPTG